MGTYEASRLQILHVTLFVAGVLTVLLGFVLWAPVALIAGGIAIAGAGILSVTGWRIALRGRTGSVLRHALGDASVRRAELIGVLWIVVGVAVATFGVQLLRHEPSPRDPVRHAAAAPVRTPPSAARAQG